MSQIQFSKTSSGQFSSLGDYSISYIADTASVVDHYHNCYTVVVSLDQEFGCMIDGQILSGLRALIVNEAVPHTLFASGASVLVNFIKPDSSCGWQLQTLLADQACLDISYILAHGQFDNILPVNYSKLPNKVLIPYVHAFLNSIFFMKQVSVSSVDDERIRLALWFIDCNLQENLELEAVAICINLSPGRTRHLFVEKMGIPFSQYVLWKRIQGTMAVVIAGEGKLTEVCLRFGFTDQSHFNHTFKRIFGLTPRSMIRNYRVLL